MTTFAGLPVHVLLVHCIVVLTPFTALLAVACALWPAARNRLIWLVLGLAVAVAILTPATTSAGEWLEKRVDSTHWLRIHTALGDTMIYFAVGLVTAVALLVVVHICERRNRPVSRVAVVAVSVLVIVASTAAVFQVYRIGESGARSVWGDVVSTSTSAS